MGELKPLEEMANDVNMGDLVRVTINYGLSSYVGYVWWTPKENGKTSQLDASDILSSTTNIPPIGAVISAVKDPNWIEDNKERSLVAHKNQILIYADNDILLAGLDPYGKTYEDILKKKVQVVGINLKKGTLGKEVVKGYEVLERAKDQD
ncbi:hypothetical protein COV19_05050 [Candidatus Woesearchaeota archaeon CG10_big_fil_rev_8_21_14_0_10_44_13]|nr:MAG: hypothetical protein COV19_05050 [Candidatus Woesearchaeota archaeon CG10_big_fil_rev_8_21_14_0_10_44_13]